MNWKEYPRSVRGSTHQPTYRPMYSACIEACPSQRRVPVFARDRFAAGASEIEMGTGVFFSALFHTVPTARTSLSGKEGSAQRKR